MIPGLTLWLEAFCCRFPLLSPFFRHYYHKAVDNEVRLGDISSTDHVLCIGCGPLPVTAMEIARRTGARITAVDICPMAVKWARRAVERNKLSHLVQVQKADGRKVNPRGYTVVHVARQVCPQQCVLDNILARCGNKVRVIVRTPHACLEKFYGERALSGGTLLLKGGADSEESNSVSNFPGSRRRSALVG